MKIKDLNEIEIIKSKSINSKFLTVNLEKLNTNCKIFKGDFYLDTYNYFPITEQNNTFLDVFSWGNKSEYHHFFTENFQKKFLEDKKKFKVFEDVVVLGSSPGGNYYRNLLTFIPRLLFISGKKINIAIHRQTPNKLREFIKAILKEKNIELKKFVFLDDNFYKFKNSQIIQFLRNETSIKILNKVFKKNADPQSKIYLTRKNSFYRKIINEGDIINELKSKNFKAFDPETLSIKEQIEIFSSAKVILSPTSSALSNIVFCNEGTKIIEIIPKYKHKYENALISRFARISSLLNCEHHSIEADPVPVDEIDEKTKRFIDPSVFNESNYYKNLLIKKENFIKFIEKF